MRRIVGSPSSKAARGLPVPQKQWLDWHQRRPAQLGQLLTLAVVLVLSGTGPAIADSGREWWTLAAVVVGLGAFLAGSCFVPWDRLPRPTLTAFPLGLLIALASLGIGGQGLGTPYVSIIVLSFAYTGLTQSPRTNALLLAPAAASYIAAVHAWSTPLAIRLSIVFCVWFLLSQLLCRLTSYNQQLTDILRAAAQTDLVTGLPNRRDLDLRLTTARDTDILVLCDLDHFKDFNDTYGHLSGDQLLAEFGLMLRTALREPDYAARFGGEEFALLLVGTNVNDAGLVVERLSSHWATLQPGVTFSAGIAGFSAAAGAVASLRSADEALYRAKAEGRNRSVTAPTVRAVSERR